MATITLKEVPEKTYLRLKSRAKRHRRSLNGEIIACLETIVAAGTVNLKDVLLRARNARSAIKGSLTEVELKESKSLGRP